ncbi:energy transducer TonB [Bdellovibrio sp. HCB337]|uniref:energy transducer TonB family protein n=1 Tax=Bdellovibrio sp. HCB337 TaxID=3394358 RepID=UPI0039A44307
MSLLRALALSLVVHCLLVLIMDKGAPYFEPKPVDITTIDLVETPKPPAKTQKLRNKLDRQVVREALAPKSELKEDDSDLARFLSADKQRVHREMQAAASGMTTNRSPGQNQPSESKQNKPVPKDPRRQSAKDFDPEGVDIAKNLKEYAQSVESAPSTVGDALPQDVSIGTFTALNTDRYVFYSFFARIEDLVRFRWESRVRQAVDSFDRNYVLSVVGRRNWITSVDIWITKDGRYHSAHILKESGIDRFDQAAILAFKEAGMFPNPPQEMVEDDGFIHLKYSFNVFFKPSAVVYSE